MTGELLASILVVSIVVALLGQYFGTKGSIFFFLTLVLTFVFLILSFIVYLVVHHNLGNVNLFYFATNFNITREMVVLSWAMTFGCLVLSIFFKQIKECLKKKK